MHPIIKFPFKLIFYYPGRMMLWFRFMFPGKGQISRSVRQYREGGVVLPFIFSCSFWFGAGLLALLLVPGIIKSIEESKGEQGAADRPSPAALLRDAQDGSE